MAGKVSEVVSRFPKEFGLRAFTGKFRISEMKSFISGNDVQLVIQKFIDGQWLDHTRGTEIELRRELIRIVEVPMATKSSNKRDLRTLTTEEMTPEELALWKERRASMKADELQQANAEMSRRSAMKQGREWIASEMSDSSSKFALHRDVDVMTKRGKLGVQPGQWLDKDGNAPRMLEELVTVSEMDVDQKIAERKADGWKLCDDPTKDGENVRLRFQKAG